MLTPNDIRIHGVGAAARQDEYETAQEHYEALADAVSAPGLRAEIAALRAELAELRQMHNDLVLERLPSGEFAWLKPA